MKTQIGIVVVGLLSAILITAMYLERHIKSQGIGNYDRMQLQRLVNDIK